MNFLILTQTGGILKPFAWIFGLIFDLLYRFLELFHIENIAVTLVLFTIIVKMLMLPLTIKQQKFSKLSAKMQPELSAIQEKYKGRKDEQSQRLMQMESQEIYSKYGTNPASGCLPLLITLPLMFAMYRIIYAIPAYVKDINVLFTQIAEVISKQDGFVQYMMDFTKSLQVTGTNKWAEVAVSAEGVATGSLSVTHIIDILTKFGTAQWDNIVTTYPALASLQGNIDKIEHIFSVGKLSILDSPKAYKEIAGSFWNVALLVPFFAIVTQLGSSLLSKKQNPSNSNSQDNAVGQSMNTMLYVMPFLSGFICYTLPLCIGIYWIINTVVSVIQQIAINIYIDRMDLDEMIEKNVEKQNKRREKLGVAQGNTMAQFSKASGKSISYEQMSKPVTTANYANMSGSSTKTANKNKQNVNTDSADENVKSADEVKAPEIKSISGYANILKRD